MWSAYKMKAKNLISKVLPVLKDDKGAWVRNPQVITDKFVNNGEIVYGEIQDRRRSSRGEGMGKREAEEQRL